MPVLPHRDRSLPSTAAALRRWDYIALPVRNIIELHHLVFQGGITVVTRFATRPPYHSFPEPPGTPTSHRYGCRSCHIPLSEKSGSCSCPGGGAGPVSRASRGSAGYQNARGCHTPGTAVRSLCSCHCSNPRYCCRKAGNNGNGRY